MTPERLEDIRWIAANAPRYSIVVDGSLAVAARHRRELIEYVDELTRQRDSARDLAVKSGIFQDHRGTEYLPDPDHPWRAEPVGAVAWDRQVEQR